MTAPSESIPRSDGDHHVRIVNTVASKEDCDPIDLPPLYDVIDPSALDSLFRSTPTNRRSQGSLTFRYCGYRVTIDARDEISVEESTGERVRETR
ncbi:HalOD1 output domain-containing protein [Natrarchaeobius sp. A-rgal3]|uniref:HalOD1 output domain-containing protein n=1 Tax=Natrarchaeobius versutus TaxID=1679078 RepID=UPI00351042DB